MLGAGTPIAAGISVPEGARLSGPLLLTPTVDGRSFTSQQGWLFVDGDPYTVAREFHEQWSGEASRANMSCEQKRVSSSGRVKRYPLVGEPADDATAVSCSIRFVLREFTLYHEVQHVSLAISYKKDLTEPGQPAVGSVFWPTPPVEVPTTLPEAPSNVGGPDQVVSDVDYQPDLQIVDGSFLAAPPGPGSLTGGFTAWIGVSGDPDEVFEAYVAQDDSTPEATTDRTVRGMRVRQHMSSDAGGITMYVTMNEIDGNAWIYVEAYND